VVVGAGPAGSMAAIILAKRGFDVEVRATRQLALHWFLRAILRCRICQQSASICHSFQELTAPGCVVSVGR
jgi:2-polyprenyl-6-methoxyphenol hydroxylase-like FAD-dependent oxidoreductase